jgi:glycerol-3-phosphate cytidylyltransferase
MSNKKTLITYGTFDLFHIGHLRLLKRIKEKGDRLVVAVSTDEFNSLKGKKTIIPYNQRKEILEGIKYVDLVIPEDNWEQKVDDIKKYQIDELVMGNDWEGKFDELKDHCQVTYLSRTKNISSTELKSSLKVLTDFPVDKLSKAADLLNQIVSDLS